ncbi:MAG TPA: hypothetical protein VFA26_19770, partial [Gemmataceae bacterium]|nr:hypothetical protein [Gemmataceae bacterium]
HGLKDVAQMTQQGVSDTIIINKIRTSPTVYNLSADQIGWLRQYHVSDAVITEMQATAMRVPQRVYVEQPTAVIVEEPPPVAVGVGIGFHRRW